MASAITYEGAVVRSDQDAGHEDETAPTLFHGQKLFFSHSVPQRQWFLENARRCGATITQIDSQADVVIFDHARKNAPPGSVSYKYVELSVRNGVLERLSDHLIASASRVDRPVGSVKTASKGSRAQYTNAEDQILWNWIKPFMDAGGLWRGNEIYKQLERRHPRHTYQSWRDRWIKHTRFQNRLVTEEVVLSEPDSSQAEPAATRSPKRRRLDIQTPASRDQEHSVIPNPASETAQAEAHNPANVQSVHLNKSTIKLEESEDASSNGADDITAGLSDCVFSSADHNLLWAAATAILLTSPDDLDAAWGNVAEQYAQHTASEWRSYFCHVIVPLYRKRKGLDTEEKFREYLRERSIPEPHEAECEGRHADGDHEEIESTSLHGNEPETMDSADVSKFEGTDFHPLTNRPPEPNESRKRKQDRSPRSDPVNQQVIASSHDQSQATVQDSQSQKRSQESGAFSNASLPDILYRNDVLMVSDQIEAIPTAARAWQPSVMKTLTLTTQYTLSPSDNAAQVQRTARQIATEDAGIQNESTAQATTHSSRSPITSIRDKSPGRTRLEAQDEWIPQRRKAESPMFFSDRSNSAADNHGDEAAHTQQSTGTIASQAKSSTDARSPSQNFETAPQQMAHTQSSLFAYLSNSSAQKEEDRSDQSNDLSMVQQTGQSRFATAPTGVVADNSRLSTQSLQNDLELESINLAQVETINKSTFVDDDFTIPPPEGGWSDEEDDIQLVGKVQEDYAPVREGRESSVANQVSSPKHVDEEDDIDVWLVTQKARNKHMDDLVIDEICIQALEATSLQLRLASFVVDALVETYKERKHPAMKNILHLLDSTGHLRTLRKRDLKSAQATVSKTVAGMMLIDRKGIWTKSDDQKLTSTNARHVKEVEDKHGEEQVRLRFKYLEQLTEME